MDKVLRLFEDETLDLPLDALMRHSLAVLGMTGTGKSNTVARIFEQLMGFGVPGVIVDIANEYWGLKEKFGIIVAGSSSPHTDIIITDPAQAAALAVWSLRERMPVILSLRNYKPDMRYEVLLAYMDALWEEAAKIRRPYKIFLEEAHNWVPQSGKAPTTDILTTIATEGRKDGLSLVVIGQRSARIDKNVLTQCGIVILHRLWMANDLNVFNDTFGRLKWLRQKVVELSDGSAVLASDKGVHEVRVLLRETYHAGYTPGVDTVDEASPPALTDISQSVLDALRDMLNEPRKAAGPDRAVQLAKENEQLRQQNAEMEEAMQMLREEIERLSKLQVIMPETLTVDMVNVHPVSLASAAPAPAAVAELLDKLPPMITAPAQIDTQFSQSAINWQKKLFDQILNDVRNAIPMHRQILAYLISHPTGTFSRSDLARRTGYSEATLRGRQFTTLIEDDLIQRYREGSWVMFSAQNTQSYLAQKFLALDPHDMMQQLLTACTN